MYGWAGGFTFALPLFCSVTASSKVCICMCMHMFVHVCMSYRCVHVFMCEYFMYVHMHVLCVCTCLYVCAFIYYTYVCTHSCMCLLYACGVVLVSWPEISQEVFIHLQVIS